MTADHEILVVGAGPTGLTLACELFRLGVGCRIVDAAPFTDKGSRAIGVSARSLEVLDGFGAARPLVDLGMRCTEAVFHSSGSRVGRVSVPSAAPDTRFPLMLSVPQPDTERILGEKLRDLGGRVEREVTLRDLRQESDGAAVTVVLEHAGGGTETISASWIVGADGAHSRVRKLSGIPFEGGPARETFAIVDVVADGGPPPDQGYYCFHQDGLTLIIPLPDGSYRVAATTEPGQFGELTLPAIQALFERRVGNGIRIKQLRDAGWGVATTQVRPRIAGRFRAGRAVIAGDAAHLFGPLGGQGMNGGIQDAQNLAWKLALVCLGAAGEDLLDTYQAERLPAANMAMAASSAQSRLGTLRAWRARATRDLAMRLGSRTGKLSRRLVPTLTQLGLTYPPNEYFGASSGSVTGVGRRIPDSAVRGVSGADTLFDVVRRQWFTVVVLGVRPEGGARVRALADQLARSSPLVPQVIALGRENTPAFALPAQAVDTGDRLHRTLEVTAPSAWLVRPDGFVAAAATLDDLSPITTTMARFVTPRTPTVGESRSRRNVG